jgi:hypothetical protein
VRIQSVNKRVGTAASRIAPLDAQAEKMQTCDGLAEIAHAINNSLAGMVQNAQVVERRLDAELGANRKAAEKNGTTIEAVRAYLKDRKILEMLDAIRTSGAQAADMVQDMIRLTGGQAAETDQHEAQKFAAGNTENHGH